MRFPRLAFVISIALVLCHLGNAVSANPTEERNFEPAGVLGPVVPAIPAPELQVSKGKVTVKIDSRKYKLETLDITPPGAGPFPLAVVSHGTPTRGGKKALRKVRIRDVYAIAEDFARRGYKAVVFARRGYASSKGKFQEGYGRCRDATRASYVRVARNGAKDYAAIIEALAREADVDGSTVIAAGHSGGGFVVSALASNPPAGLVGIINFAGGRGGQKDGGNCSESGFVGAFGEFGKGARVPALWLYATTDRMFWPELIDRSLAAYASNGAPVRLEHIGPLWYTDNGHSLHLLGGREYWRPRIDAFLNAIGAPNWEATPDDAAVTKMPPPVDLGSRGSRRWRLYLGYTGHKAFALGEGRQFGWSALQDSPEDAMKAATRDCEKRGGSCRVVSINGEMIP